MKVRFPFLLGLSLILSATAFGQGGGGEKTDPVKKSPKNEKAVIKPPAKKDSSKALVTNRYGIGMVWIPPGRFMMGSDNGADEEKPVHRVTITKGFYIGRYEVTQAQWKMVMGNNPSEFKGDSLPVEHVSWLDAEEFIRKLNQLGDGYYYRLPTEAEWEYACRAGLEGDNENNLESSGWYSNNSIEHILWDKNNRMDSVLRYAWQRL